MSKNYEDNQDILDKFNSLIKDVQNIQKVIKHKKASIFKNNPKLWILIIFFCGYLIFL